MATTQQDVTFEIGGFANNLAIVALREEKPEIFRQIQAYYNAVIVPEQDNGVLRAERVLIAQRVAELIPSPILGGWYGGLLAEQGGVPDLTSARIQAILDRVALVTENPNETTPEDLASLRAAGLNQTEIIAISQLIAFVHYHARLLAGLAALGVAS